MDPKTKQKLVDVNELKRHQIIGRTQTQRCKFKFSLKCRNKKEKNTKKETGFLPEKISPVFPIARKEQCGTKKSNLSNQCDEDT